MQNFSVAKTGQEDVRNPNKRFQINKIKTKNEVVDLTLIDDDESGDDDIVIMDVKELKSNMPLQASMPHLSVLNAVDAAIGGPQTQEGSSATQMNQVHNANVSQPFAAKFQGLNTPQTINDERAQIIQRQQIQNAQEPYIQQKTRQDILLGQVPLPPNRSLTPVQINSQRQMIQKRDLARKYQENLLRQQGEHGGARIHADTHQQLHAIEFRFRFYNSEKEVLDREKLLLNRYEKVKDMIKQDQLKLKTMITETTELNALRDRLKRLSIPSTDKKVVEIVEKLSDYSKKSLDYHKRIRENEKAANKAKDKYLNFRNREKNQIIDKLRARSTSNSIQKTAGSPPLLLKPPQDSSQFQFLHNNVLNQWDNVVPNVIEPFQNMRYNMENKLTHNEKSGSNDNGDEWNDVGGLYDDNEMLRRMTQMHHVNSLSYPPNSIEALNAYNTEDSADLRHLLESVKTLETAAAGESKTPDDLTVNLMTHQRMGLNWLETSEDDKKKRGGILSDDMGLGKTVQMISLTLSHRSQDEKKKTNLIICPVSLMNQWASEYELKVKESANIKVFIFHQVKKITFEELSQFDIVITSYGTVSSEYKKHIENFVAKESVRSVQDLKAINDKKSTVSSYKSPLFGKESQFYRIILDEAHVIKNKSALASVSCTSLDSTYRWCLSGTPMQNKIDEIYPLLRFLRIKPYDRENKFRYDILIPLKSNNVALADAQQKAMNKVRVLIKAILLRREKNSQINGKPILSLPKKHVLQEAIHLSTSKDEESFYYSMENSAAVKVARLLNGPKAKGNYSSILTLLLRLRQACLHSELVRISERKLGIEYDSEGKINISKASISSMCEYTMKLKNEVVARINNTESTVDSENRFECLICIDSPADEQWTLFYPCGHGLCNECVEVFFEKFAEADGESAKCTVCYAAIRRNQLISYDIFDRIRNKKQKKEMVEMILDKEMASKRKERCELNKKIKMSPKMEYALNLIKSIFKNNPDEKVILFSQFISFFNLFVKFLTGSGIDPLLYVGSMSAHSRNEAVKKFYRDPTKRLILISIKAGNVGLTLTCANHVIIMDPFWNPYVEEQAQDRAYRIGQTKEVKVYRLLAKDTVEDRIIKLQKKKKELISSALSEEGRNAVARLNKEEIGFLFGLNRG